MSGTVDSVVLVVVDDGEVFDAGSYLRVSWIGDDEVGLVDEEVFVDAVEEGVEEEPSYINVLGVAVPSGAPVTSPLACFGILPTSDTLALSTVPAVEVELELEVVELPRSLLVVASGATFSSPSPALPLSLLVLELDS